MALKEEVEYLRGFANGLNDNSSEYIWRAVSEAEAMGFQAGTLSRRSQLETTSDDSGPAWFRVAQVLAVLCFVAVIVAPKFMEWLFLVVLNALGVGFLALLGFAFIWLLFKAWPIALRSFRVLLRSLSTMRAWFSRAIR